MKKPALHFARAIPLFVVLVALLVPLAGPVLTGQDGRVPIALAQDGQGNDGDAGVAQPAQDPSSDDADASAQIADRDGDGIYDDQDDCPDDATNTCNLPPDRDADGIADDQDECPDDATDACNLLPDFDSDGIADDQDACPDDPTDTCMLPPASDDGVTDDQESCPADATEGCSLPSETPTVTETPDLPVVAAVELVSVGDRIWYDVNKNGVQDSGEWGAPGISVALYDGDDLTHAIDQTVTDTDGYYWFTNLTPGAWYGVQPSKPAGFSWSPGWVNDGNGTDSRLVPETGVILGTVPGSGTNQGGPNGVVDDPGWDAGLMPDGGLESVGDRVWYDQNQNGLQDFGESGAANIGATLRDANDNVVATTTTDSNGYYWFTGLVPGGYYTIVFDKPTGTHWTQKGQDGGGGYGSVVDAAGKVSFYAPTSGNNLSGAVDIADNPRLDAGLVQLVSIGDRVWYDTNGNGIQDAEEPGAPDVGIALSTSSGVAVGTTSTNQNGYYWFTDLEPGFAYTLTFTLPTGYKWTQAEIAGGNGTDSRVFSNNQVSFQTPLQGSNVGAANSTDDLTLDAGLLEITQVSIGDRVWWDPNRNGIQDTGEPGVAGVSVWLMDAWGTVQASTTTDQDGYYWFANLDGATTYIVRFDRPANFAFTTPDTGPAGSNSRADTFDGTVSFSTPAHGSNQGGAPGIADDSTIDAGLIGKNTVSVGDRVWYDTNANGIQDEGEPNARGIAVSISDSKRVVASTTTNDDGFYVFTNLNSSTQYELVFTPPPGYLFTTAKVNNGDGSDSVPDATGTAWIITPASGGNLATPGNVDGATFDAGLIPIPLISIGGRVWYDIDGDGIQDLDEPDAPDVTVSLYLDNYLVGSPTTTGADGRYVFTDLQANTEYRIDFVLPDGYIWTIQNAHGGDGSDSQISEHGEIFVTTLGTGDNQRDVPDQPYLNAGLVSTVRVSVGDFVWVDQNGNGLQDLGEPGFDGATITLYDFNDNQVGTTTSQNGGYYAFADLIPGQGYRLHFDTPDGYSWTPEGAAANSGIDSAVEWDGNAYFTAPVTGGNSSVPGQVDDPTLDAGLTPVTPVSIGDRVWYDTNKNGIQDIGELGAPNIAVQLYDGSETLIGETQTDANGNYVFQNLQPNTEYRIQFIAPPQYGWTPHRVTGRNGNDSAVDSGGSAYFNSPVTGNNAAEPGQIDDPTMDAGLVENGPVSVGDFVWYDTNGNGLQDPGEPGAAGVHVVLTEESTNSSESTTTNGDGYYAFTGLTPSAWYTLQFTAPDGFKWTQQFVDGDFAQLSTVDSTGFVEFLAPIVGNNQNEPGQADDATLDAGLVPIGMVSVGGRIWYDTNGNGLIDAGEPPVVGADLELLDANWESVASTTTNANGAYSFTGLESTADYQIEAIAPGGYKWTWQDGTNGKHSDSVFDLWGDARFVSPVSGNNLIDPVDDPTLNGGLIAEDLLVSVGDRVWLDQNGNGLQDDGEPGVPNVTVRLYDESGSHLYDSTTTDANGHYAFTGLDSLSWYSIQFTTPSGYKWTSTRAANGNGTDSAVDENGMMYVLSPAGGANQNDIVDDGDQDAGLIPIMPVSAGGGVWYDLDGNGMHDQGELAAENVTVRLYGTWAISWRSPLRDRMGTTPSPI